MTFKDLENWQKELVIKNLKDGENIYIEYTKDDIIASFKQENQELKNQQKEFIEWLEENIYEIKYTYSQENGHYFKMDDILKTYQEVLSKYKEIIGSDNK
ncbi:hypothetical protein [uncultured Megamonas sp.]|uniref:hypothetical protein n=1 Tax=uncultured Megamonas sp. TaxID=286140 RepID=UPI00259BADD1|nr:hypothetical protein [uncultured Megamonas sp.]